MNPTCFIIGFIKKKKKTNTYGIKINQLHFNFSYWTRTYNSASKEYSR